MLFSNGSNSAFYGGSKGNKTNLMANRKSVLKEKPLLPKGNKNSRLFLLVTERHISTSLNYCKKFRNRTKDVITVFDYNIMFRLVHFEMNVQVLFDTVTNGVMGELCVTSRRVDAQTVQTRVNCLAADGNLTENEYCMWEEHARTHKYTGRVADCT